MMRSHRPSSLVLLLLPLLGAAACQSIFGPNETAVTVEATVPETVTLAVLEVTSPGQEEPTEHPMDLEAGVATATVNLEEASELTFRVRAFDADSIETHRGSATEAVSGESLTIQVVLEAVEGGVPVEVTAGMYTVTVSPVDATIAVGATRAFTATVTDADGSEVEDATVGWASANPGVVSVGSDGTATGQAAGSSSVVATFSGVAGRATVTVQP